MAIAPNADVYAAPRVGLFFPGITSDLNGQCVSLVKWFLGEMTAVPNPQAARGDARYVGQTLVAQGLAVEVPYDQRRRGDVVCLEYGIYGHIYIQLSNGRVFEENVNWPGVEFEIIDGARVYAARIGSDSESWRHDAHVYRINSYNETGDEAMINNSDNEYARWNKLFQQVRGRAAGRDEFVAAAVGRTWLQAIEILSDDPGADATQNAQTVGQIAVRDQWAQQIYDRTAERDAAYKVIKDLQAQIADLGNNPTQAQLDALNKKLTDETAIAEKAQADLDKVKAQQTADTDTGNSFLRWLGGILNSLKK